jgi:hypothetical protein
MGFALEVGHRGPFLNAPPNAKLLLDIRLFGWARFGIGNSVHLLTGFLAAVNRKSLVAEKLAPLIRPIRSRHRKQGRPFTFRG